MNFTNTIVPQELFYAFWDVDKKSLDLIEHKKFIVSRMFERGKFEDVLDIVVLYGKDEVAKILENNEFLSQEGIHLAHAILDIPLDQFKGKCFI